jgi:hypothetical protein
MEMKAVVSFPLFPRSAWEHSFRRSAALSLVPQFCGADNQDAERPQGRSHAERGNERMTND